MNAYKAKTARVARSAKDARRQAGFTQRRRQGAVLNSGKRKIKRLLKQTPPTTQPRQKGNVYIRFDPETQLYAPVQLIYTDEPVYDQEEMEEEEEDGNGGYLTHTKITYLDVKPKPSFLSKCALCFTVLDDGSNQGQQQLIAGRICGSEYCHNTHLFVRTLHTSADLGTMAILLSNVLGVMRVAMLLSSS